MKVVHLSTIHGPLDVRIFNKECQTLLQAGYEVHQVVFDPPAPAFHGVVFHSIKKPEKYRHVPRIFARLYYAYKAAKPLKADIYHFHDPELVPVGLLLKLGGAKVIYDIHEDSPQEARSINRDKPHRGAMYFICYSICDWAAKWLLDGLVSATPALERRFLSHKTVLVQNFPVIAQFRLKDAIPYAGRRFMIVYVGGIAKIRGIREMVQAMDMIPRSMDVTLALAGRFDPPELKAEVERLIGWRRIDFLGWLTCGEVSQLLSQARLGLVLLNPTPEYLESQPVKLYEYMAAGLPIIASDFPLWRELYGHTGGCLFVDPLDPKAIADVIQWVLEHPKEAEDMGRKGREAVERHFNWDTEGRKLLNFYKEVLR